MNRIYTRLTALLLALVLLLSCAACDGDKAEAATMKLTKTEGTVGVSDGEGRDVEPREDLGLYSGYQVETKAESYAWIDLDSVKLAKLDESSEVEIQRDGKNLKIILSGGSVFFNVTKPLEDDESMTIRTSTIAVSIRGTCGWVECGDDTARVHILEGRVRCRADGAESVNVSAGEMAEMKKGSGQITVRELTGAEVPDFVLEELTEEEDRWQGHRYQVFSESMTWREAEEYCRSLGGHLATITSAAEEALIVRMLEQVDKGQFWLGATDEAEEGEWVWVDGEKWSYTNWAYGEPNNSGGAENYLAIRNRKFLWNDYTNEGAGDVWGSFGFVCEWDEEN